MGLTGQKIAKIARNFIVYGALMSVFGFILVLFAAPVSQPASLLHEVLHFFKSFGPQILVGAGVAAILGEFTEPLRQDDD